MVQKIQKVLSRTWAYDILLSKLSGGQTCRTDTSKSSKTTKAW